MQTVDTAMNRRDTVKKTAPTGAPVNPGNRTRTTNEQDLVDVVMSVRSSLKFPRVTKLGKVKKAALKKAADKYGGSWAICDLASLQNLQNAGDLADQRAELCLSPTDSNQMSFVEQLKGIEKQRAEDKAESEKQRAEDKADIWRSIGNLGLDKLFNLASEVLRRCLAAVKRSDHDSPDDIWSTPMQENPAFRDDLQSLCRGKGFPSEHLSIFRGFNDIRLSRNGGFDICYGAVPFPAVP